MNATPPRLATSKWVVVFLIWLMMLVAYMDRVNISQAIPDLGKDLHFGKPEMGSILAAFSIGYALLQIPGGWLSDRLGAKPLLVAGLLIWSLFTGITGLCTSLASFIVIRMLFGAGEGLENGAQFKLIGDHFSERERSRASGIFLSSLALGPAIATPVSVWLIKSFGWREMFYCFAGLGVVVALILAVFLPKPEARAEAVHKIDFKAILGRKEVWLLLVGYLLFNIAFWGFVGWTPTYLREQRHFSLSDLGWVGAIPYVCGFLGMLVVGHLGSKSLFGHRNVIVAVCYVGAAASLIFALSAGGQTTCLVGLSFAAFFLYSAFAPFWALAIDLTTPETRGGLTGFINFGGQLGGFLGQFTIGILWGQRHSFNSAIVFMCATLVIGSVVLMQSRPPASPLDV